MKRLLPVLLLLAMSLSVPALAREWYRPAHEGKEFVNCDLTVQRASTAPKAEWNGQLVLWDGTVSKMKGSAITLMTEVGPILVNFPRPALTLDRDRTGYHVAIKGALEIQKGKLTGLSGRSCILLGPPKPWTKPAGTDSTVAFLQWWMQFHNPQYSPAQLTDIATALTDEARKNGLDPFFLASLVQIESAFKIDAVSGSGAVGLGQLMPFVASGMGVDPYDPKQNLAGSAKMLAGLLKSWDSNQNPRALALASYNAGPNLVKQVGGVPRLSQPTNYVYFIGYLYEHMRQAAQAQGVALN